MKLTKMINRLGKIQPFYFVSIYLLLIVLFATIYYFLPLKSFYHSTSKYEYSKLDTEADVFLSKVKKTIQECNITENNNIIIDTLSINLSQLRLHSLSVKDFPKSFTFKMSYLLNMKIDSNFVQISQSPIIRTILNEKIIFDNKVILPIETDDEFNVKNLNFSYSSKLLFIKDIKNGIVQNLNYPHITIDLKLYKKLINIGNAYKGYPKNVSGHWLRTLYLSMGISTSTVFGDIVPLNSYSRFLVSFQGFLSIIIISLFFNSIASSIEKNSNRYRKQKN